MEKKKKRRQFDALFTCKFEWSSVAAQLPLPHTFLHYYCTHGFSSCLALIHSFSPATIHFLKRKNQDKKKKIDDIHPCLCSCLQFSASFFFDHSMDPSNGRFMLMHLRPSMVGTRMHCLVARSLNIVDSQLGIGMENCNVGADNECTERIRLGSNTG